MPKKIAIIGTVGLPATYGGFETLAEHLTKHLSGSYEMTVYCSSKSYEKKAKTHHKARLIYLPLQANGMQSILYDIVSIIHALFYADVLLILGVSGCVILPVVKLISNKTIIVNIDGLEWQRAKWGRFAKWFLKTSEAVAVKYADHIIADNKVIQDYVQKEYHVKSALIAYGADHTFFEKLTTEVVAQYPFLNKEYAFKVCRIEPENNIKMILEAFADCPAIPLVLIGNWNNNAYGKDLRLQFSSFKNIHLLDPIYNQTILNQIRSQALVYVHGHSAGGTNPSLVEAMYLGLPVIAYGIHYNKETTAHKALYFKDKAALVQILKTLDTKALKTVGLQMKTLASTTYTWPKIVKQYAVLFQ